MSRSVTNTLMGAAVRVGNVSGFNEVLKQHGDKFKKDNTYTLILR